MVIGAMHIDMFSLLRLLPGMDLDALHGDHWGSILINCNTCSSKLGKVNCGTFLVSMSQSDRTKNKLETV